VDDDVSVREALPDLLRSFGFSVDAFGSAEEFLNAKAFETSDGWIVIDAHSQKHWRILCEVLGVGHHADDPKYHTLDARRRNKVELVDWLGKIIRSKTIDEWMAILGPAEIPVAPINTVDRTLADPSLIARKMIVEYEHTLGGKIKSLGNPVHMTEQKEQPYTSPPLFGEHTESVLREVLGYDQERIRGLLDDKIVTGKTQFPR